MICRRCKGTFTYDEHQQVQDSFDLDFYCCLSCAREIWQENQQDQLYDNPAQDAENGDAK